MSRHPISALSLTDFRNFLGSETGGESVLVPRGGAGCEAARTPHHLIAQHPKSLKKVSTQNLIFFPKNRFVFSIFLSGKWKNGSIKIARSLGVRDDDGKPKKVSGQKTGKWFSHPAKGDLKCWKVIRKWFTILLLIRVPLGLFL